MYSSVKEYFTTMDFLTTNKSMWTTVFQDEKHHQARKEIGVTYASYSSNRNNDKEMSVCFKYDNQENMNQHKEKISTLLEENREKWSALGDLDSIEFKHWRVLAECTNDKRFDKVLNKTDDVFWLARHTVDNKEKWVESMKAQQDQGMNFDIRWWGLMENVEDEHEVSCVYRLSRDRLQDFVLNFVESMSMFKEMAGIDVNSCRVKFVNVEWETMYNMPISFQHSDDDKKLRSIIEEITSMDRGRHHMDDSCVFVRPTGNPLNMEQWDQMMNSDDVKMTHSKLVGINKLEIFGNMAYACYTSHTRFNFKGTENDDVAVFTGVFRKSDGVWKMVFGQRSTGRKPEEEMPQF
jgi:hypothetical protein